MKASQKEKTEQTEITKQTESCRLHWLFRVFRYFRLFRHLLLVPLTSYLGCSLESCLQPQGGPLRFHRSQFRFCGIQPPADRFRQFI